MKQSKRTLLKDTDRSDPQWKTKRLQVEDALRLAYRAKERIRDEVRSLKGQEDDPSFYQRWADRLDANADGCIQSFEFFLSADPVPEGYRFAGWINISQFVMNEIDHVIRFWQEVQEEKRLEEMEAKS